MSIAPTCTHRVVFVIFMISMSFSLSFAQRTIDGFPTSFDEKYRQLLPSSEIANQLVPSLNLDQIKKEDAARPGTNRYAAPVTTNFTLDNAGTWTQLPNGDRVWRLKIQAKDALGLCFLFKDFHMPNGSRLFMYNEEKTVVKGAYSSMNNLPHQKFMTGMIEEEAAILEYFEPKYSKGKGRFEIYQVMQAYDAERMQSDYEFQTYSTGGFGSSLSCERNINCNPGNVVQNQKRGIVRIRTAYTAGLGWCTGTLINNTNNDGTPYILTANHCGNPTGFTVDYTQWRFDFNYEFPDCGNSSTEPTYQSIHSAQLVSNREESDFLLLSLYSFVPNNVNAYFNGWDRSDAIPQNADMIHHPCGDVKKHSQAYSIPITVHSSEIEWDNIITTPPNYHFRAVLNYGTMEPGSSGCPIFNPEGRIVGQLHGGNSSCSTFTTYHGRLHKSWDDGNTPASRLQNWLDPIGTGVTTLDGINAPPAPTTASVSGMVMNENGVPITNVNINVTGDANLTIPNNINGTYQLSNLAIGNSFTVAPTKEANADDGVTTFDMVLMQQQILGHNTLSPYKLIAADVNDSGTVTTFDMVLVRRVILQLDAEFELVPNWKFIPADFEFPDPTDPFDGYPEVDPFSPLLSNSSNRDYIAIKMGDMNDSAE